VVLEPGASVFCFLIAPATTRRCIRKRARQLNDRRSKYLRRVLRIEELENRVRPKLRPLGILAASIFTTALLSTAVGFGASAVFGRDVFYPTQMLSGGAGKALSLVLILALSRDDYSTHRLFSAGWKWWSVPVGFSLAAGLFLFECEVDSSPGSMASLSVFIRDLSPHGAMLIALSAVVFFIGGGVEELLFRGLIQTSADRHFTPVAAIVATAILFSFPHLHHGWIPAVELFLVSVAFSWCRRVSGSLVLPVLTHGFHNALYGSFLAVAG
jgi:membrane protease YdiL (CAAX protease family)